MKTSKDPRHLDRVNILKLLFAWQFSSKSIQDKTITQIAQNIDQIDAAISQAAPSWPIEKINKIDLAILRLAVHELLIVQSAPPKVVVDEAVELAKEYGSDSSPGFVNGALGKLILENKISV